MDTKPEVENDLKEFLKGLYLKFLFQNNQFEFQKAPILIKILAQSMWKKSALSYVSANHGFFQYRFLEYFVKILHTWLKYFVYNYLYSILGIPAIGKIVGMEDPGPMKVLKAARVLRPLKLVSGVPSMFNLLFYAWNRRQKDLRILGSKLVKPLLNVAALECI